MKKKGKYLIICGSLGPQYQEFFEALLQNTIDENSQNSFFVKRISEVENDIRNLLSGINRNYDNVIVISEFQRFKEEFESILGRVISGIPPYQDNQKYLDFLEIIKNIKNKMIFSFYSLADYTPVKDIYAKYRCSCCGKLDRRGKLLSLKLTGSWPGD